MKQISMQMTGARLNQKKGLFSSGIVRYFRKNWILYLFVLPTILWYIIFRYFPMPGVYMAFTRYKGIGDIFSAKFVGFKWFESFFQSAYAKQTLVNTLRLSFYSLALFPLPIIFAVIVNEIRNEKFKKVTQTIVYAPHFVSLVILVTMLGLFLDAKGIVNNLLTSLGMEKIDFLTSDSAYPHVFVWSGIWSSLGWSAIIYTAALSGVDPSLHEAAKLDGASRLQRIWHINLPASTPVANFTADQNGCTIDQSGNTVQWVGWIGMDNADGTIVLTFHFNNAFTAGQSYVLPKGAVFGFTDGNTYTLDADYTFNFSGYNKPGAQYILKAGTSLKAGDNVYTTDRDYILTVHNDYLTSLENIDKAGLNVWIRNYHNTSDYFTGDITAALKLYQDVIDGFYMVDGVLDSQIVDLTNGSYTVTLVPGAGCFIIPA